MRRSALLLSGVLVVLSLVLLVVPGLNLGIDFTGGALIERKVETRVTTAQIRSVLTSEELRDLDLGGAGVQILDTPYEFLIRTRELSNADIMRIDEALNGEFGGLVERRTEMVGPVIGEELVRSALMALLIAAVGILIYVTLRFEYRFAVSAILAVLHDVLIVLGVFVISGRELNSPFVAAILTVVGYSINDTIVIFDRVRENVRNKKRESYEEVVNNSLNETIRRTISTSVTTLCVVLLLFLFGGSTIKDISFALLVGVLVGTYSSIFVASSVWLDWTLALKKKQSPTAKA